VMITSRGRGCTMIDQVFAYTAIAVLLLVVGTAIMLKVMR